MVLKTLSALDWGVGADMKEQAESIICLQSILWIRVLLTPDSDSQRVHRSFRLTAQSHGSV